MCTFWFYKLRRDGVRIRNLAYPIEMAGHPYNSAAIPYVMLCCRVLKAKALSTFATRRFGRRFRRLSGIITIVAMYTLHCIVADSRKCGQGLTMTYSQVRSTC